jgi:hypothetical protein
MVESTTAYTKALGKVRITHACINNGEYGPTNENGSNEHYKHLICGQNGHKYKR